MEIVLSMIGLYLAHNTAFGVIPVFIPQEEKCQEYQYNNYPPPVVAIAVSTIERGVIPSVVTISESVLALRRQPWRGAIVTRTSTRARPSIETVWHNDSPSI